MSGDDQMMLWPDLPVPAAAPTPPRAPRRRRPRPKAEQLAFAFRLRRIGAVDSDDEDDDDDPFYSAPVHRVITGPLPPAPDTHGAPRSVFDLAAIVADAGRMLAGKHGRFGSADGFAVKRPTVVRTDGATRVVGAAYPANRWDEERIEQERIRRAKQRPPRPTKKAKTRSAKLRELIGEPHDE